MNRVVVITGASAGVGRAAARAFAERALADYGKRFSRDEIIARLKEVYLSYAP